MRNFNNGGGPSSERTRRINALSGDKQYTVKKIKSELDKKGITYADMEDQRKPALLARLVEGEFEEDKAPPVAPILGALETAVATAAAAPLSPPYQPTSPLRPSPIVIPPSKKSSPKKKSSSKKVGRPKIARSPTTPSNRMGQAKTFAGREAAKRVLSGKRGDPLANIRGQLPTGMEGLHARNILKRTGYDKGLLGTQETAKAREAEHVGDDLGAIMENLDIGADMEIDVVQRPSSRKNTKKNVKARTKKKRQTGLQKRQTEQRRARVRAVWKSRNKSKKRGGKRTRKRR